MNVSLSAIQPIETKANLAVKQSSCHSLLNETQLWKKMKAGTFVNLKESDA